MKTLLATLLLLSIPSFAKEPTAPQVVERPWLLEDEKNTINIFEKAADNVVFVHNSQVVIDFFTADLHEVPAGAGTGFVWSKDGYIVTNFHVIDKARKVTVTLKNGKKLEAKVVGSEPRKDIALLKVTDTKDLPTGFSETLADSSQAVVGQKTIAIGNPFELSHTLTTGVVSALNRPFPSPAGITIRDMIQTDASINMGNSGGPLMDSRGHLLGMNTAIYSPSGGSAGVGFAVPSNTIKRVVSQLIKSGKVTQPYLGVVPLPERYYNYLNLKNKGIVIVRVVPGKAAQKAGLQEVQQRNRGSIVLGDIITGIDGTPVKDLDDLYNVLEKKNVGDKINVEYFRKGEKKTTTLILDNDGDAAKLNILSV